MIAAADGSFPETHATTAPQWDRQFAAPKLAMEPFNDRLSSLVSSDVDEEMATPRSRGRHSLTSVPTTVDQAWGCHAEYLSGTASWEQWNLELRVRRSPEFRALAVDNFRTKAARALRDDAFGKRSVAFLHEASRYRGKARGWFEALTRGESYAEIAEREGVWKQRIQQMLPLAFLAPDIVQMIAEGRQPVALTCEALINADLPIDWADQRTLIARL